MNEGLKAEIESVLFASAKIVKLEELARLTGAAEGEIKKAILSLTEDYEKNRTSLSLADYGNAWKLTVKDKYMPIVEKVVSETELPKSILETLAVIAFRHPILQAEVVKIRSNKAYDHLRALEEMGYIRREKFGRTNKIHLTQKFFDYFELPPDKIKEAFASFNAVARTIDEKERESLEMRRKAKKQKLEIYERKEEEFIKKDDEKFIGEDQEHKAEEDSLEDGKDEEQDPSGQELPDDEEIALPEIPETTEEEDEISIKDENQGPEGEESKEPDKKDQTDKETRQEETDSASKEPGGSSPGSGEGSKGELEKDAEAHTENEEPKDGRDTEDESGNAEGSYKDNLDGAEMKSPQELQKEAMEELENMEKEKELAKGNKGVLKIKKEIDKRADELLTGKSKHDEEKESDLDEIYDELEETKDDLRN